MKRINKVMVLMATVSTLTFSNMLSGLFGPSREEVTEFRYKYAEQILTSDVTSYDGEVLTLDEVLSNITDGVVIDDLIQNGFKVSPSTDIPLEVEEIQAWANQEPTMAVPTSMMGLLDTYKVKYLINPNDALKVSKTFPLNTLVLEPEIRDVYALALLSGRENARQIVTSRKTDMMLNLDKKSQAYSDIMKLSKIDDYIVTFRENEKLSSGSIVFDNNIVIVEIPYTFDKEGVYNANLDLSEAVVKIENRDPVTNELKGTQKLMIPSLFDATALIKERVFKLGIHKNDLDHIEGANEVKTTNFYFLREIYGNIGEAMKLNNK